jgi:hypothetical protein
MKNKIKASPWYAAPKRAAAKSLPSVKKNWGEK